MAKLPPEVISRIVGHLLGSYGWNSKLGKAVRPDSIALYATINHEWQSLVESRTFRNLVLTPFTPGYELAEEILTPARLSHVRKLRVDFVFPAHQEPQTAEATGRDLDDQLVFNQTVKDIFNLLSRAPQRESPLVSLIFRVPTPSKYPRGINTSMDLSENDLVAEGKLRISHLELSPELEYELLDLPVVSEFTTDIFMQSCSLVFAPRSVCVMAGKMSRLQKVTLALDDGEKVDLDLRIQQRISFSESLEKLPLSLRQFNLRYVREPPKDHSFQPRSVIPVGASYDPLSEALHRLSQRKGLSVFDVEGCVDATIFWPLGQDPEASEWPDMNDFSVDFHAVLPSGQWLGVQNPECSPGEPEYKYSFDEPDNDVPGEGRDWGFREHADAEMLNSLYLAAGRAACRMPRLASLKLQSGAPLSLGLSFCPEASGDAPSCLEMIAQPTPEPCNDTEEAWKEAFAVHGLEYNLFVTDSEDEAFHFSFT